MGLKSTSCPNFSYKTDPKVTFKSSPNLLETNKFATLSFGAFLIKHPNATKKQRRTAIYRFLNSIY